MDKNVRYKCQKRTYSFLIIILKNLNTSTAERLFTKNYNGSKGLNFEWNYTQLKFKQGTVEKNESTIGPPAGIKPTLLRLQCNALATEL